MASGASLEPEQKSSTGAAKASGSRPSAQAQRTTSGRVARECTPETSLVVPRRYMQALDGPQRGSERPVLVAQRLVGPPVRAEIAYATGVVFEHLRGFVWVHERWCEPSWCSSRSGAVLGQDAGTVRLGEHQLSIDVQPESVSSGSAVSGLGEARRAVD